MRNITKYILISACTLMLNSCDAYLDKQPDDAMTMEMIFQKRASTQKYLVNVFSYMIDESHTAQNTPWLGASDEACITYIDRGYCFMNNGSWSADNPPYVAFWRAYYQGIREANIFMQNVDKCPEINFEEKLRWKTEARFMRTYYYVMLMRMYGPVVLVGDELIDIASSDLGKERSTWEECMDYICSGFDEVADILPEEQETNWYGKPTKGAALALKARMLLYSARELYNSDDSFYKNIISTEGKHLFPQSYSKDKWKLAAEANKAVIDMGIYDLYKSYATNGNIDPYKSYAGIYLELWNNEVIFGRALNGKDWRLVTTPRGIGGSSFGGVAATQKMVDAYAMKNGRYPISGYTNGGKDPIIVESSYSEGKFQTITNPADGTSYANTNTMYKDREPRFYVSICWSGEKWKAGSTTIDVQFYNKGNSGPGDSHNYSKTGYLISKMTDHSLNHKNNEFGRFSWPICRLGEIYLNYAEALNEYDPGNDDILKYVNLIRQRAGIPNLEEVYPEEVKDPVKMRQLIRRERQIELAFEGYRFFDTRTWRIAEETENGPVYGMNIMATDHTPTGKFWERTIAETRVFNKKHYLFPIAQEELDRNKAITQNYLW